MTLIISVATPLYSLQVADRLLTVGGREVDPVANKTLIYEARDGIVVMSYTGAAFRERTPTDEWLAERLWGRQIRSESRDDYPVMVNGWATESFHVGNMIARLVDEMERSAVRGARDHRAPLQVAIVGWQWNRRYVRPVLYELNLDGGDPRRVRLWRSPREWRFVRRNLLAVNSIPDNSHLDDAHVTALVESLRECWPSLRDARELVVKTIRDVAKLSPLVGSDCIAVSMPRWSGGMVEVEFLPATLREGAVFQTGGAEITRFEATFTPWVMNSRIVCPPSIMAGPNAVNLSRVSVNLTGPDYVRTSSTIWAAGGLRRPRQP